MEKLANHTLVYDSECPMCDLYTKGFIKAGMLDTNGRVAYGCAKVPVTFDNLRARNEIALIDYEKSEVTYGLDSLVKVIGHSFPLVGKIAGWPVFRTPLNLLYSFISYNRKVIAPPKTFEKRGACTPEYRIGYRIGYIIFAWLLTSFIASCYFGHDLGRELLLVATQVFIQMVIVLMTSRDKLLHYIGNMMTVSLIGSMMLLPMMILNRFLHAAPIVSLLWFVLVVTFMLFIHWRRVKWLGMAEWVQLTWIASMVFTSWLTINLVI